jgi:hypothetical protein
LLLEELCASAVALIATGLPLASVAPNDSPHRLSLTLNRPWVLE